VTRIRAFSADVNCESFAASDALTSQVYWKMAVTGEAAMRALQSEPDLKATLPELVNLADVRNRLIHGYETVSSQIVWSIIRNLVPPVLQQVSDYVGDTE
jgi:uncharacterized protein with HEPN domain